MLDVDVAPAPVSPPVLRLQWRDSLDGITWSGWHHLPSLEAHVSWRNFVQLRGIWPDGEIETTPIGFDAVRM